jgi:hypothetical protein
MQGQDLVFFIQNKQGNFWQIDHAGDVTISSNPYPIVYSPDGWQDIGIKNIRNKKYWGIDRTISIPFKYVEDAAEILKFIFYKKGIEESTYLVICEQRLDYTPGANYGYWYKQVFKGEIDFSTFDHTGVIVTLNTAEEGLAKHLKANENTVYEFPLNVPEAANAKMDGVVIDGKFTWTLPEDPRTGATLVIRSMILTEEQKAPNLVALNVSGDGSSFNPNSISADDTSYFLYFSQAPVGGTGKFTGTIKMSNPDGAFPANIRIDIFNTISNTQRVTNELLFVGVEAATIPINHTFTILAGDRIFFSMDEKMGESTLTFETSTRFQTTFAKALRPQYLFSELISKVTEGQYTAEDCPYFSPLRNAKKVFTSGNGLRGIADATLKISLSQFFSFWNTYDEVGIREKDSKILFDRKKALIDFTSIIDLGEISGLKVSFDKEMPFNELAIGYPDVKNEAGFTNGKNEFNTTFVFSLGTTKTPRRLEKISQVQASCYAAENVRIDNFLKDTTDNKSDNEPFVLDVENTLIVGTGGDPDHYKLDRSLNPFIIGVDQKDSVFNAGLSPKRCLINSGDFLRSSLYLCDNKTLKFIGQDRNDKMEYVNGSDVIIEKADKPVGSLADKFFLPVIISIETDAPVDLLEALDSNPLQIFQFTLNGDVFKMIPLENGINPQTNKKQTYTGWATADTNLEILIKYFG